MSIPDQPPDGSCLFLDVDGTLIDLAPTPDAVVVPEELRRTLDRLAQDLGGAIALVSGRSIASLDHLFAPLTLCAAGVHGAELRLPGDGEVRSAGTEPLPTSLRSAISNLLGAFPGTLVEDKVFSYAVHYRGVPDRGPALAAELENLLSEAGDPDLQILPGHFVYEVKRQGFNKGAAIRTFMDHPPFAGRVPVFIGDDVTDVPGFAAAAALGGRAYSVTTRYDGVDGTFAAPADVRRWLGGIVRASSAVEGVA